MESLKSFEEIVNDFEPMIKNMIKSLHIYKNFDEFYQHGLIGLWEAYHRFDSTKGAFASFAQMTVRGKMLSLLKKEQQFESRNVLSETMLDQMSEPLDEEWIHHEILLSYCKNLSKNQKKWVIKTFIENKKPKQISIEENVSIETVKTWRKKALAKLRKEFNVC